ncbi:MAG: peptide deformylase [Chitinivibrionales bacterium]|nr:peptide deformylase [Chitinivibrionales bacterium]
MDMFEVCIYGNPVLRKKAEAVTEFNDELKGFVEEMAETMKIQDGVGLAAPQVSKSLRIAVIDTTGGEQEPYILINPEIIHSSEEREDFEEGCLSIPDIRLKVNRPLKVSIKAFDAEGREYSIENAEGLLARALQHEIDHLDGVLFIDRASPVARQLVSGKLKKMAKSQKIKNKTV